MYFDTIMDFYHAHALALTRCTAFARMRVYLINVYIQFKRKKIISNKTRISGFVFTRLFTAFSLLL